VNNWNYTENIHVVLHYLIDNYVSIVYVLYDIWSILLVPWDFDRKNKESFQLWNVIRVIGYEFACASNLVGVLKYISLLKA
jgi:NADH:ubiquinone oxidoreductase subunit 3 (subunit A)